MNFANPDMVGHTGKLAATIAAIETTDAALAQVIDAVERAHGVALITADHGNAESMADPATGQAHTAHDHSSGAADPVRPDLQGKAAQRWISVRRRPDVAGHA